MEYKGTFKGFTRLPRRNEVDGSVVSKGTSLKISNEADAVYAMHRHMNNHILAHKVMFCNNLYQNYEKIGMMMMTMTIPVAFERFIRLVTP